MSNQQPEFVIQQWGINQFTRTQETHLYHAISDIEDIINDKREMPPQIRERAQRALDLLSKVGDAVACPKKEVLLKRALKKARHQRNKLAYTLLRKEGQDE